MAKIQFKTPNLFQLHGSGIHITYSTSGIDGKPHFSYQDAHQTLNFSGNEIQRVDSELGATVSVFIRRTIDSGSTTFSLLVPRANLTGNETIPIHTVGLTAVHRFSIVSAFDHGQLDTYTTTELNGTASAVVF